ncbi:VOC family protein [Trinickia diaoshuihuensis]|uniref:VOC family protein n=1 Tax=Trinickia diaoshuihuensis TaxID=2292265 RepID=UPI000E24D6E5|nr:VOC family protein [Trinickia diaoshuihuensis]
MAGMLSGIDHFVIAVRDLDAARENYARMGFALTPRGHHTVGSENHCAIFGNGYLELLALSRPNPVTAYFSRFLEQGDGAAAMVVATGDAQALFEQWRAAGLPAEAPLSFSRPVSGSGGDALARFRITQLDATYTPGGLVFACEHLTPELVYRPEQSVHPNGTIGLAAVTISIPAAQLNVAAHRYARVLSSSAAVLDDTDRLIQCGDVEVRLEAIACDGASRRLPCIAGLTLMVESLDLLSNTLRATGIAAERSDGALSIDNEFAHGITLRFIECDPARCGAPQPSTLGPSSRHPFS